MDMFADLLTSSSRPRVSAETLEMLGRKASQLFQRQGIPLNDAVRQVAANMPELGNEHIKRIVEFANTVTFQEQFQNSTDKNVHFEVADPGVVLRDLKDGGSPAHDGKTMQGGMGDYLSPPSQGSDNSLDSELAGMFGQEQGSQAEHVKLASVGLAEQLHSNPIEDVYDTHVRLQAAREKVAEAHESLDLLVKQAKAELYDLVKQEVVDPEGAGLGGVISVFDKVASRELAVALLEPMVDQLASERIDLNASLEKRAGLVVNPEHPLVQAIAGIAKLAHEHQVSAVALQQLDDHLQETSAFLKNAGALTTGVKKAIGGTGKVPNALRQRFSRK